MAGLLVVVLSIAAVDSLNPSTVGPALVLAALAPSPGRRVAAFAVGVFTVSTLGGIALLVGPGRNLLARLATPSPHVEHVAAFVCGAVLLCVAIVLWTRRRRPRTARASAVSPSARSGLALGSAIMAIELPTALPYFAAIVAIVESRRSTLTGIVLVCLYNVVFVAPLLLILALSLRLDNTRMLELRLRVARRAPTIAPVVIGVAAIVLLAFGAGAF